VRLHSRPLDVPNKVITVCVSVAVVALLTVLSLSGARLAGPAGAAVSPAAAPSGYWLVGADGGLFTFGSAQFHGSTGSLHLSKPIVGMAAATDGGGYWLVASDGGVFTYGDAAFHGSAGGLHLKAPIVGMAAMPDGGGYWLVASDGGVFTYGDAAFHGSTGALHLNAPIVGMAATPDGGGYWLVATDGGIFNYGDARFEGSTGGIHLNVAVVAVAALSGGSTGTGGSGGTDGPAGASAPPAGAPVSWCETGLPQSPYGTAPTESFSVQPNTTYWFAPGTHTLGAGEFDQLQADPGDTFVGAPGAVIDGQGLNNYAFEAAGTESSPANVTIEYLTVQHFIAPSGEGVVGQGDHDGWTIENDLIQNNPDGAGVVIGNNDLVQNNCLRFNGEYGFNGLGNNAILTDNDIYDNNNLHAFDFPGSTANDQCGCSGGGKWWEGLNDQTTDNYVHGNQDVGIWYDTDNAGALISGNYVSDNYSVGIQYEASYNAEITDNTLVGNAIGEGSDQDTPGFPDGAIYISESGGDSRVASNYSGQLLISGNVLTNNWGGVILWENSDRYCSDGSDNACTLINPSVYTESSCTANLSEKTPVDYYDNCRWKTQNVTVEDNSMTFNATTVGTACTVANLCGFNGLFSNYGTSQYNQTGPIAFRQGNVFSDNTYTGPWHFWAWSQSNEDNPVTWSQWTAAVTDQCGTAGEISSGTCSSGFGQDAGSTLS
jgi:hypothetical protein